MLIEDPNLARGKWHMGKASEVFPSQDKLVRVVQVTTKDGTYTKLIHKLCLLECTEEQQEMMTNK